MKRFRWKLQRVLDIKRQRERALRHDLFMLAQEIARVQEAILERRTRLRTVLEELARRSLADRIAEQAVFMQFAGVEEAVIRRLQARRHELDEVRSETQQRFLEVRASCKMLVRLREEAYRAYVREVGKREQATFDESAHVAYARRHADPDSEREQADPSCAA